MSLMFYDISFKSSLSVSLDEYHRMYRNVFTKCINNNNNNDNIQNTIKIRNE